MDYSIADQAEAEGLAMGRLQSLSYGYVKGEGAEESGVDSGDAGNGEGGYTGKYIAERVTHSVDLWNGYITSFDLKRNMPERGHEIGVHNYYYNNHIASSRDKDPIKEND